MFNHTDVQEILALVFPGAEVVGYHRGGRWGMLERFCRHLEGGWRSFLRSRRHKRMLYSAFWVHGAETLEPSLPFCIGRVLVGEVDALNRRILGEPIRLGFLYPSKTLAFIKQFSRHTFRSRSLRISFDSSQKYQCERFYSTSTPSDKEAQGEQMEPAKNKYLTFRELIYSDESRLYDEAWRHFINDPKLGTREANQLISYLKNSDRRVDQLRTIEIGARLQLDQFESEGCDGMVKVYLAQGKVDEAFLLVHKIVELNFAVALKAIRRLIAYGIDNEQWGLANQTFQLLLRVSGSDLHLYPAEEVAAQVFRFIRKFKSWLKEKPTESYQSGFALWLGQGAIMNALSKDSPDGALNAYYILQALHPEGLGAEIGLQPFLDTMMQLQKHQLNEAAAKAYLIYRDTPLKESPTPAQVTNILYGSLKAFGALQDFRNMERVFDDWFHFGARPNAQACLYIMRQFAAQGETTVVKEFYDYYARRFPVQVEVIETIMHAHTVRGEVKEVLQWFDTLPSLGLSPTTVTYNIVLNAHKQADDVVAAFRLFNTMLTLHKKLQPDIVTYHTMMSLCANRGDVEGVELLLNIMKAYQIPITQSIHNAVTYAYSQQKNPTALTQAAILAKQITEEKAKSQDADLSRMWNNILVGYLLAGDMDSLAATYHHMRQQEIPFDGYTYSILLHSLCMSDKARQAERMFEILQQERTVKLNQAHYATLMLHYMMVKDITKVWSYYNKMLKAGLAPTFITQAILIQATTTAEYREYKKTGGVLFLPEAEAILKQSTSDLAILDLTSPDKVKSAIPPFLFIPLMQVYAREGSHQRTMELFERFLEIQKRQKPGGTEPSIWMYLYVMNGLLKAGETALLLDIWKKARAMALEIGMAAVPPHRKGQSLINPSKARIICPLFSVVVKALPLEHRVDDIKWEMDHLLYFGFKFDNVNMNDIVQAFAVNGMLKHAFEICEERLMPGYYARYLKRKGDIFDKPKYYPFIRTFDCLITEVKAYQLIDGVYKGLKLARRKRILTAIESRCPKTWAELNEMEGVELSIARERIYQEWKLNWKRLDLDVLRHVQNYRKDPDFVSDLLSKQSSVNPESDIKEQRRSFAASIKQPSTEAVPTGLSPLPRDREQ